MVRSAGRTSGACRGSNGRRPENEQIEGEGIPKDFNLTTAVAWRDLDEPDGENRVAKVGVFGQTDNGDIALRLECDAAADR